MSDLTPEREALYRDLGLDELLEEPDPVENDGPFYVDDRVDGFGNPVVLEWDPTSQIARVYVAGVELETTGDRAYDLMYHTYPYLISRIGEVAADEVTGYHLLRAA